MAKRILKNLTHYGIWQFFILGLIFFFLSSYLAGLLSGLLSFEFFKPPKELFLYLLYFAFAVVLFLIVFNYEKNTIYKDKTHGRNFRSDFITYRRSWSEMIDFFATSDKYRLDPKTLPVENWKNTDGIILGHVGNRLVKRNSDDKGNLALFALPGGGKTTSQMITTGLRFGGSILAIDIKGDILSVTKKHRNIKVFSPDCKEGSCSFNPFYGLKDMPVKSRKIILENMATILIPSEKESYFSDGARDFFCGIALYMLHENVSVTFPEVVKEIILGNGIDWVMRIKDSSCVEAQEYTNSFYGTNEKNTSGCYLNLSKKIRPFSNGDLNYLLSGEGDCISPETLESGIDVYIEIPQDKIKTYAPLTTILIQTFMNAFLMRADLSTGKKKIPILFLLDEFNELNFDYDTLMTALATLRSKKVSLFMAMQSISQLKQKYGDEEFRGIIDTCGYVCLMSAQDPYNRQYFQELIGKRKTLKSSVSVNDNSSSRSSQEDEEYIFDSADFNNLGNNVLIYSEGKYIVAEKCNINNKEALAL